MNWGFTKHQVVHTETQAIALAYLYILMLINSTINREGALRLSDIQALNDYLGKDLAVTSLGHLIFNDTQTYTNIRLTMYNNYSEFLTFYYLRMDKLNSLKGNPKVWTFEIGAVEKLGHP